MRTFLSKVPALALVALAACGQPHSDTRVIVFGVDGMDPEMLQERIDRGLMPNFKALLADGGCTFNGQPQLSLQTSWPPQSPVAWSNFITGVNPGKHGLYDFIHVDRKNYGIVSSMSDTSDVGSEMHLFGYTLPLSGGEQTLTRQWPAFWEVMAEAGVPVAVHRMPANFPMKETTAVTFPDMGAPDLLGAASGKAYLWSDDLVNRANKDSDSSFVRTVEVNKNRPGLWKVNTKMYGPENTMLDQRELLAEEHAALELGNKVKAAQLRGQMANEREVSTPITLRVDLTGDAPMLAAEIDGAYGVCAEGEWSQWVPIDFEMIPGLVSLSGWTRFLFKSAEPFEVYASPVQIDPFNPAMPVSTPDTASADLAKAIGPYYTQGFPDAYKSYKANLLNTGEFVSQSDTVFEERARMMDYAMGEFEKTGGLLFFYTGSLDLRCHMLWHCQDDKHPHQEPAGEHNGVPFELQIDRVYKQVDGMLGDLLVQVDAADAKLGGQTEVIVMSDHGFASFRRKMHVNDWLIQEGYLVLKEKGDTGLLMATGHHEDGSVDWDTSIVDWSKTTAYSIGFNNVILNRAGREAKGVVSGAAAGDLLAEMQTKLLALRDSDGTAILTAVEPASAVFQGEATFLAPDLQLGFNVGYGCSDESASGTVTGDTWLVDIDSRWSGSHLMDPELVRGVVMTRAPRALSKDPSLEDITATLYEAFRVAPPAGTDGQPLFQ